MFLIVLLYMLFALTFTLLKAAVAYTTPIFLVSIRMFFGGLLLVAYHYSTKQHVSLQRKDINIFAQASFFQYYAAFVLEAWSLQWVSSYKACLFFNLSPFITAVISFFLLREYMTMKKIVGLIIGFIGLLPILMAPDMQEQQAGSLLWLSLPELALLGSVFCASYGWIAIKQAQRRGYHTVMINAYTMTAAGIAALFTSLLFEGVVPVIEPPAFCYATNLPWLCSLFGAQGAGLVLFAAYTFALIIIANVIAFNLYGYLISIYSPTFVSFAGFITPLFAALFGWFFLGELIQWQFMMSMVIVLAGLLLFYQEELQEVQLVK